MRLIDAEKIEEFASRYTEFDGEPLTDREKDLVRNVCGKISTVMPAYDTGRLRQKIKGALCCNECQEDIRKFGREETCRHCWGAEVLRVIGEVMEDV